MLAEKMAYPRWGNEDVVDRRQDGEQVGGRKCSHHFLSWVIGCLYELDVCSLSMCMRHPQIRAAHLDYE